MDSEIPEDTDSALSPEEDKNPSLAEIKAPEPEKEKKERKRRKKDKKARANIKREASQLNNAQGTDTKKALKKDATLFVVLLVLGFIGLALYYTSLPRKGSMAYGICRVFLERYVQYPSTLRISTVKEFTESVRIWYIQTDSFGQYRMEPIRCYYKADAAQGYILDKITVRRKKLDREQIESFNKILPVIRASNPDLTIPHKLPDNITALRDNVGKLLGP